jgi:uncharacterized protein
MKEDLTFSGLDIGAFDAYDLGDVPQNAVRVLFRPPSETSHYYRRTSTVLARAALERLAAAGAFLVFSPRERNQVALLTGLTWKFEPVVLQRPVPFVELLKSVDAVVCAGGTMLREAAYLGVPAYSIFRSEIGDVDRWLERIGRVKILNGPQDVFRITINKRGSLERLDSNRFLLEELVAFIAARAGEAPLTSRSARPQSTAVA